MKRKTTITLIITGLSVLAGLLYASPTFFSSGVSGPIGIAATTGKLYVTDFNSPNISTIDGAGNAGLFATIPGYATGDNLERYLAISPGLGMWALGDIYVTQGAQVYKVSPDGLTVTLFATLQDNQGHGCGFDHTGITFDQVGTSGFNYDMIVTCNDGGVWRVNPAGNVTFVANTGTNIEGPAVAPQSFGPLGGQIWVTDENNSQVHAIASDGTVTYGVVSWGGAEGVLVVPSNPCTLGNTGAVLLSAILSQNSIYKFSQSDLSSAGGKMIVTSETGQGVGLITTDGTNYNVSTFDNSISGADYEGSAFVDCQSGPAPSPTPTATATAIATATPTPTPTATPACWNYDKYAVFGLNSCKLSSAGNYSNPYGVVGDLAVGSGSGSLLKTTVNGKVFVDTSATPDVHADFSATGGIFPGQNLNQDKADALNLSTAIAGLAPTQTFGNITAANTTITRTTQLNVISVNSISLTKKTLTLNGTSTDTFIINVTSPTADFVLNGSSILLTGGLTANHVLLNFPGTGGSLYVYKASTVPVVNGTLLAPQRDIVIDNPPVSGSVIGSSVYVHSSGRVLGIHCQ